jgi:thiamine transport system permease protein
MLVFVFSFTSFGVILLLGGLRFATVEVEIYHQAISYFDLSTAAALSLIQMGVILFLLVLYSRLQNQIAGELQSVRATAISANKAKARLSIAGVLLIMFLLLFLPLSALVVRSFSAGDSGWTMRYYTLLTQNTRASILFVSPVEAIRNSILVAVATTAIATCLGLLTAVLLTKRSLLARLLDPIFMLPLAASAVTLGFGFIIALDEPPLNLRTSPLLLPIAHTLVALPFVIRSLLPALRRIPPQTREAAQTLGASPWKVLLTIDFPLIRQALAVGAIFAFTVSMGEFGATVFVARPEFPTIPVAIYRLIGQPGMTNYGQAMALSVILMAICGASFVIIDRLRPSEAGEF